MKRHFYVGEGERATDLLKRGYAQLMRHLDDIEQFRRRHGADAISKRGDQGRIHALAYEYDPRSDAECVPPRHEGLTYIGSETNPSDLHYHLFRPDTGTTEGLAIDAEIQRIGGFSFSSWALAELGVPFPPDSDPLAPISYACICRKHLLVSLVLSLASSDGECRVEPPPWLREISKGEFNKLMEG